MENRSYFASRIEESSIRYNKINWHKTISSRISVSMDDSGYIFKSHKQTRVANFDEELLIFSFYFTLYINKTYGSTLLPITTMT